MLRRFARSIALLAPPVRNLRERIIATTSENTSLRRENESLRALLGHAPGSDAGLIEKNRARYTFVRQTAEAWHIPSSLDGEAYAKLLGAQASDRGAACRWCEDTNTALIQRDVSRYGERSFDVWHCFACSCRFAGGDLPDVDYDGISRRHAWFRLLDCDGEHVKNVLSCGSEYLWAYMAAKYLADVPWFPDRRHRAFLEEILNARIANRKLGIVEVGCGPGMLGGIAGHLGHDYLGVDVMTPAQSQAVARFNRFGARFESVPPDWFDRHSGQETYDLVYSSEVIEHTPKPLSFLRKLVSLAKPGGLVILTTPDLDLNRDKVWATDLPPVHTVFLNRAAMTIGLKALNEPLDMAIANEGGSFDWRRTQPKNGQYEWTMTPALPRQLDPSQDDFGYDVKNVPFGSPMLDIVDRPERLSEHYREQMLVACLENVRAARGSMIINIKRPMA